MSHLSLTERAAPSSPPPPSTGRSPPPPAQAVFEGAIADFSEAYTDQNAKDHAAYIVAIKESRVLTTTV